MSPRRRDEKLKHHLKIFLVKEGVSGDEQIFKRAGNLTTVDVDDVGTLYYEHSFPRKPGWLKLFDGLGEDETTRLRNSSTRAILLVEEGGRQFALAFGYGRYLLRDGVIDPRFGLRVTLNSVAPNSLRSIDKVSIGSVPLHTKDQLSRSGSAADFGLNFDEDLVRAVSGTAREPVFGATVAGGDVLAVTIRCDLEDIKPFLGVCLEKSASDDYKQDFAWVDQVQEITDRALRASLNSTAISQIAADETEKIWLAVPDIVDWADIVGFRYTTSEDEEPVPDMSLTGFLGSFQRRSELSLAHFKNRSVYAVRGAEEAFPIEWKAFRCLYAEIDYEGRRYLLTNGLWYEIDSDYVSQIESACERIPEANLPLPAYETARYKGRGNDKGEAGYNHAFASADPENRTLLDAGSDPNLLVRHGGGNSAVEFCDILTQDHQLVHIKRYGGSSSLSHLFQQGTVSAELFREDETFREKVNNIVPEDFQRADPQVTPMQDEYEVIFVIINKTDRELDLPFFSKISLQAAARRLRAYGYKVSFQRVPAVA